MITWLIRPVKANPTIFSDLVHPVILSNLNVDSLLEIGSDFEVVSKFEVFTKFEVVKTKKNRMIIFISIF